MKTFPAIYFILPALVLSSCSSYQYVSPLPSTPQFTESGEVQGQLAVGFNHYEMQGSVSFLKNFGVGFTAFNAPNSSIRSYNLHYFRHGKKWPNLYTSGYIGYDKGKLQNEAFNYLHEVVERASSNYETFRFGGGMYYKPEDRLQFGCFLSLQQIQFYEMAIDYETSGYSESYIMKGRQNYRLLSPNISLTTYSKNGLFFLRSQVIAEIPLTAPLNGIYQLHSPNYYIAPATHRPRMSTVTFSMSLGMRLVPLNLLKR